MLYDTWGDDKQPSTRTGNGIDRNSNIIGHSQYKDNGQLYS